MAAGASWGIEVGAGSISAIKLQAKGESVELADFVVIPHKRVLSTPDIDPDDVVKITLGMLANRVDLSGASVVMSLPGHAGFARFATLPPVDPKKVGQIVAFEAKQQIPFPLDEVEWDYQTFVSPESPDVEVGIFAVTKERLSEQLRLWAGVDITPDMITLSPLAAYNAMAYDLSFGEKTPGTIIVDVGTTSTDLVIAEPGRAWVRTFPIGGHHFTQAIANTFNLSYVKAEKLKKEFESTKHAKHVMQAMKDVFHDLSQDIQRSIGYYQSLHPEADLQRLVGVGSTFRIPGLQRYLKQQLQMNVSRVDGFKRLTIDSDKETDFADASLNLVTAYGLALQGMDDAALVANLMPSSVMKAAMWKRKVPWFGVAAGLSLAATGAMFIRPMLDNVAISNSPQPPIISQVVNSAQLNKSDAGETTSPMTDYSAVNMLTLLDSIPVYEHLTNDLSLMLENADETASKMGMVLPAGSAAFELSKYTTKYMPSSSVQEIDDMGVEIPMEKARVDITIELTTLSSQSRDLIIASIDGWLRANKDREDVPYKISWEAEVPWVIVGPATGELVLTESQRAVMANPSQRVGNRRRRGIGGSKNLVGGGNDEGTLAAKANTALDSLAPISATDPGYTDQTRRTTFKVSYTAELRVEGDQGGDR